MNKDEFVQFWMLFYDKFFKIDTNQVRIIPTLEFVSDNIASTAGWDLNFKYRIWSQKDQFISVMEVINYFCAHDMEHFKKAGEFVKGPGSKRRTWLFSFSSSESVELRKGSDLNLDGKVSVLEFFLSFPDLESLLEEDL